jgi:hypothetical protein
MADNPQYDEGNSETQIPVQANTGGENYNIFNEPYPNAGEIRRPEDYGFFKEAGKSFGQASTIANIQDFGNRLYDQMNPLDDYVQPNWNPYQNKDALIGVDPRNAYYILNATGPKDQQKRRDYILSKQENDESIANGGMIAHAAGGFLGGTLGSPESWIPIAASMKFSRLSETFIQNAARAYPGIAIGSAAHNAAIQSTNIGGNLRDFALDTFADTVLGTSLMGVGAGGIDIAERMKIFNAKGIVKMMSDGIEPQPILNDKGERTGWKAVPMDAGVGAAKVDAAQAYLDASISKNSLYSIPYIGDKLGTMAGVAGAKAGGIVSPIVRMATSKFPIVRAVLDHVAEHGFETQGIERGVASPDKVETDLNIIRADNRKLFDLYNGLFLERNGIKFNSDVIGSKTKANITSKIKEKTDEDWISKEEFGREVTGALISNEPHPHNSVNSAVEMIRSHRDPVFQEYLRLHGYSDQIISPKTSDQYAHRAYNVPFMETNEQAWIETISKELSDQDSKIRSYLDPINNSENQYKLAKQAHEELAKSEAPDEAIKASSDRLENMQRSIQARKNSLHDEIRDNPELHHLADNLNAVSASESDRINEILKYNKDLERDLNSQKKVIADLKSKINKSATSLNKSKTSKTAKKHVESKGDLSAKIAKEEKKLKEIQDKLDTRKLELENSMANGKIDKTLYYKIKDSNRYELKDPNDKLKFRDVYESDHHRQQAAKAYYDTILNNTSEDLIRQIMGRLTGNLRENPIKGRTLLIPDKVLYANNFLHTNPIINLMNYRLALGRQNAVKRMLNRLTINGTWDEITDALRDQHEQMKASINTKDKKKYDKEVKKLAKAYGNAKSDLNNTFAKINGSSKYSARRREWTAIANLFAVSTKLGFLPLTMSTDLMANVFHHGFWPFVRDGLLPMLKSFGGTFNKDIRENAAHAHIADNHLSMTTSERNWAGSAQTYTPVQGKLINGLETLAHYSMNLSGANAVDNFIQRTTAMIMQSKIMKSMMDHLEGKLKPKDRKDLLKYGLDPDKYAQKFVDEWKAAGSDGNGFGGFMSRYWEWKDLEASNQMSKALMRASKDVAIRRGMFDAPFAMDDPLVNSLFLFKGYTFASITRYLAPLLQRPDFDKVLGTMLMMAAGATQNPLRRIVNGQDPLEEDDNMFRNAVRDGGVFSILGDTYEDLNFLTSSVFQDTVNNERYRNRLEMGVFNGPIGGIANDMSRVIGMAASGDYNQQDMKRLITLVPLAYSWQFREIHNKMLEGLGLPKNRNAAIKQKEANQ